MAVLMGGNRMVEEGQPAFNIMTNFCDFFELGQETGSDVWLTGDIVGPEKEFVFNGRLFLKDGRGGVVLDSFPKADAPNGWTKRQSLDHEGYELLDDTGEIVFGFRVDAGSVCHVTVNLYRANGSIAAHGGQGELVTHGIPVKIGRNGIRIG